MSKEESIVLSKGWYWAEKGDSGDFFRWMSDSAEIFVLDNEKYDFVTLKFISYEPRKCSVYIKQNKVYEKIDDYLIVNQTGIKISLKNCEAIKIDAEYFMPDNGDNRRLSLIFQGVYLEKNGDLISLDAKQIKTGFDFGDKKMLDLELDNNDIEIKEKLYSKISNLPDDFDWEDYAFKNGDKRIKTKTEAVESYLLGEKLLKIGEKPNKTLLVSTLFFLPDEKSENFLNKIIPELYESLHDQINLVFVIRDNSFGEGSKHIKELVSKVSKKFNVIYTEGSNFGYGKGHNYNYEKHYSDYFLILNDDLDFLSFDWLKKGLIYLENNEKLALVGSDESPKFIDKFGFGRVQKENFTSDYVEGSILLVKSKIFNSVKGFDENIEYFYYEDVDLSLRVKQLGYDIDFINIPHCHYRSNSAKKVSPQVITSISELNRAKFLSKWSFYIKNRKFKNKSIIMLESDGFGDLTDCYYPAVELLNKNKNQNKEISIYIPNKKMNFLYQNLGYKIENSKYLLSAKDYDQIYTVKDINFSSPFHTLDLIAARFGLDNFSCDETKVKDFVSKLDLSNDTKKIIKNFELEDYFVIHLDSQRKNFEGRQPVLKTFIPSIDFLSSKNNIVLIGDYSVADPDSEYEEFIKSNKNVLDLRNVVTVQDMAILVSKCKMFFGIDSGPSHLSQLFNIPSFVLYGPIHPLTKVYRYKSTGTYYKNDKSCGQYHRFLEPSYYYDIERSLECIDIDAQDLARKLSFFIKNNFSFDWTDYIDSLRFRQREWIMLQMHNPLFSNRLLVRQDKSVKEYIDEVIRRS